MILQIPPLNSITSRMPIPKNYTSIQAKNNAERGKEFRAKRKRYEEELERRVNQLRAQVENLQRTRILDDSLLLLTPFSESGSVTKMIREYFRLFRFGLFDRLSLYSATSTPMVPKIIMNRIEQQEHFLHSIMDENAVVSGRRGPNASLEQWRLFTLALNLLRVEVERIETIDSGDQSMIKVHAHSHFRFCYNTFQFMFPGALHNRNLMEKFLDREVVCKAVFTFNFTDEGMISSEAAEFGDVQGYLDAGCSLSDVCELMKYCVISKSEFPPDMLELEREEPVSQEKEKLKVEYLLS